MKVLPTDFDDIKQKFNEKVDKTVYEHSVPDDLIINWDQTGCQLILGGTGLWQNAGQTRSQFAV